MLNILSTLYDLLHPLLPSPSPLSTETSLLPPSSSSRFSPSSAASGPLASGPSAPPPPIGEEKTAVGASGGEFGGLGEGVREEGKVELGPEWKVLDRKVGKEQKGIDIAGSGSDKPEEEKQRQSKGAQGEENETGGRGGVCAAEAAGQGSYASPPTFTLSSRNGATTPSPNAAQGCGASETDGLGSACTANAANPTLAAAPLSTGPVLTATASPAINPSATSSSASPSSSPPLPPLCDPKKARRRSQQRQRRKARKDGRRRTSRCRQGARRKRERASVVKAQLRAAHRTRMWWRREKGKGRSEDVSGAAGRRNVPIGRTLFGLIPLLLSASFLLLFYALFSAILLSSSAGNIPSLQRLFLTSSHSLLTRTIRSVQAVVEATADLLAPPIARLAGRISTAFAGARDEMIGLVGVWVAGERHMGSWGRSRRGLYVEGVRRSGGSIEARLRREWGWKEVGSWRNGGRLTNGGKGRRTVPSSSRPKKSPSTSPRTFSTHPPTPPLTPSSPSSPPIADHAVPLPSSAPASPSSPLPAAVTARKPPNHTPSTSNPSPGATARRIRSLLAKVLPLALRFSLNFVVIFTVIILCDQLLSLLPRVAASSASSLTSLSSNSSLASSGSSLANSAAAATPVAAVATTGGGSGSRRSRAAPGLYAESSDEGYGPSSGSDWDEGSDVPVSEESESDGGDDGDGDSDDLDDSWWHAGAAGPNDDSGEEEAEEGGRAAAGSTASINGTDVPLVGGYRTSTKVRVYEGKKVVTREMGTLQAGDYLVDQHDLPVRVEHIESTTSAMWHEVDFLDFQHHNVDENRQRIVCDGSQPLDVVARAYGPNVGPAKKGKSAVEWTTWCGAYDAADPQGVEWDALSVQEKQIVRKIRQRKWMKNRCDGCDLPRQTAVVFDTKAEATRAAAFLQGPHARLADPNLVQKGDRCVASASACLTSPHGLCHLQVGSARHAQLAVYRPPLTSIPRSDDQAAVSCWTPRSVGEWLGDGYRDRPGLCFGGIDRLELEKEWRELAARYNETKEEDAPPVEVSIAKDRNANVYVSSLKTTTTMPLYKLHLITPGVAPNPFTEELRRWKLHKDKSRGIPSDFFGGSTTDAYALLAGLINSDGCLMHSKGYRLMQWGLEHKKILFDASALAESLGISVSPIRAVWKYPRHGAKCFKRDGQERHRGWYFDMSGSKNSGLQPFLLPRKRDTRPEASKHDENLRGLKLQEVKAEPKEEFIRLVVSGGVFLHASRMRLLDNVDPEFRETDLLDEIKHDQTDFDADALPLLEERSYNRSPEYLADLEALAPKFFRFITYLQEHGSEHDFWRRNPELWEKIEAGDVVSEGDIGTVRGGADWDEFEAQEGQREEGINEDDDDLYA